MYRPQYVETTAKEVEMDRAIRLPLLEDWSNFLTSMWQGSDDTSLLENFAEDGGFELCLSERHFAYSLASETEGCIKISTTLQGEAVVSFEHLQRYVVQKLREQSYKRTDVSLKGFLKNEMLLMYNSCKANGESISSGCYLIEFKDLKCSKVIIYC